MRDIDFMKALYKQPRHIPADIKRLRFHYLYYLLKAYQNLGFLRNMDIFYADHSMDNPSLKSLLRSISLLAQKGQIQPHGFNKLLTQVVGLHVNAHSFKAYKDKPLSIITFCSLGIDDIDKALLRKTIKFTPKDKIYIYKNSFKFQEDGHNCGRFAFLWCKAINSIPNAHELLAKRYRNSQPSEEDIQYERIEELKIRTVKLRDPSYYPKELHKIFKTSQNTEIFNNQYTEDDQTLLDYFKGNGYSVPIYNAGRTSVHNRSINHKGNKYDQKVRTYYDATAHKPSPYYGENDFLANVSAYDVSNIHVANLIYYAHNKKARRLVAYLKGLEYLRVDVKKLLKQSEMHKNSEATSFYNQCLKATKDQNLEMALYKQYEKPKPSYTFINTTGSPARFFPNIEKNRDPYSD